MAGGKSKKKVRAHVEAGRGEGGRLGEGKAATIHT